MVITKKNIAYTLLLTFPLGCNLQPDTALYFAGLLLICPFSMVVLQLVLCAILSAFYLNGTAIVFGEVSLRLCSSSTELSCKKKTSSTMLPYLYA